MKIVIIIIIISKIIKNQKINHHLYKDHFKVSNNLLMILLKLFIKIQNLTKIISKNNQKKCVKFIGKH